MSLTPVRCHCARYEHAQNMALQAILNSCLDLHDASEALLDPTADNHLAELGRWVGQAGSGAGRQWGRQWARRAVAWDWLPVASITPAQGRCKLAAPHHAC